MTKTKKLLAVLILTGILFLGFGQSIPSAQATDGGAGWVFNAMWGTKEFGLDTAARAIAQGLLKVTINTMIQKIQTAGRQGRSPSFIQNWRNYLTEAQYRGEDIFRSILSSTQLCLDFGNDLQLSFRAGNNPRPIQNIRTGNFDPYTLRARCTMPSGWTFAGFRGDFGGNGGFDALNRVAEPQNNFWGSMLMAIGEAGAQRSLEALADNAESTAGGGFTGIRGRTNGGPRSGSCDDPPVTLAGLCIGGRCSSGGASCSNNAQCPSQTAPSAARCTFLGKVYTPGQLLGQATAQTIDKKLGWLITSDEVSEVIVAVIFAVMDRLDDFMQPVRNDRAARQGLRPSETSDPYTECVYQCNNKPNDEFGECLNRCAALGPGTGAPPTGPVQATLYTDPNYGGPNETFTSYDEDLSDNILIRDDAASSIKVSSPHTIAILCKDKGAGRGAFISFFVGGQYCRAFTQDTPHLLNLNDRVSSIDILPGNVVTLCPEENFTEKQNANASDGYCESFAAGQEDPDLRDNAINNDKASSILIPFGWSVTLYEAINYGGGQVTLTNSVERFSSYAYIQSLNDKVSSIKVSQAPVTACSDGVENERTSLLDGLIDLADPDCKNDPTRNSEEPPLCSNGLDDDNDGTIDYAGGPNGEPADASCNNDPNGTSEGFVGGGGGGVTPTPGPIPFTPTPTPTFGFTECNDGFDNDNDGWIDLLDPDCNNDPNTASEGLLPPFFN